jgi:hypothetical protein
MSVIDLPKQAIRRWSFCRTTDLTDTTEVVVQAAPIAGQSLYITDIHIQNADAAVDTWVNLLAGSGGSIIYTVFCDESGGGAAVHLQTAIRVGDGVALYIDAEETSGEIRANIQGYVAPFN